MGMGAAFVYLLNDGGAGGRVVGGRAGEWGARRRRRRRRRWRRWRRVRVAVAFVVPVIPVARISYALTIARWRRRRGWWGGGGGGDGGGADPPAFPCPPPLPSFPLQGLPLPIAHGSPPAPLPLPLPVSPPFPLPLPVPVQSPFPLPFPLPLPVPVPSPFPLPLPLPLPVPLPLPLPFPLPSRTGFDGVPGGALLALDVAVLAAPVRTIDPVLEPRTGRNQRHPVAHQHLLGLRGAELRQVPRHLPACDNLSGKARGAIVSLSIGVVARRPRRSGDLDIEDPAADGDRRRRCNRSSRNGWCPRCRSTSERRRTQVPFADRRTNRPGTHTGRQIAWKAVVGREWLNGQGRAGKRRLGAERGNRAGAQQRGARPRASVNFRGHPKRTKALLPPPEETTRPKSSASRRRETQIG